LRKKRVEKYQGQSEKSHPLCEKKYDTKGKVRKVTPCVWKTILKHLLPPFAWCSVNPPPQCVQSWLVLRIHVLETKGRSSCLHWNFDVILVLFFRKILKPSSSSLTGHCLVLGTWEWALRQEPVDYP
jgi:hypothetical protein